MKSIWENRWFSIPVVLFFFTGLLLAWQVPYGDEILYFNAFRREPLNAFFRYATYLGEIHAYVIAGVAALFWRFRYTVLIALTGLLTLPTVYYIKESFAVDRPITFFRNQDTEVPVITIPGVELNIGQTSFPSGHTTGAFALFSTLTLIAGKKRPRLGLPFALLAILTGLSRVFLVQHFLVDVLAGGLLGLAIGWLVWQIRGTGFFQNLRFLDGSLLPRNDTAEMAENQ